MTLFRLALLSTAALAMAIPQTAEAQLFGGGRNRNAAQVTVVNEVPRCTQNFGTISISDTQSELFAQMGLGEPTEVLRHLIRESGCFRLIERGPGLDAIQRERNLGAGGRIRTADFVLVAELANPLEADSNDRSRGLLGSLASSGGRMLLQAGVSALAQDSGGAEGMGQLLSRGASLVGRAGGGNSQPNLSNSTVNAIKDLKGDIGKGKEDVQIIMSIASVPLAEQVGYTRRTANKDELRRLRIRDNHFGGRVGAGYENEDEGKVIALGLVRAYADLVISLGGTGSETPDIVIANREAIEAAEEERIASERQQAMATRREEERREALRREEESRLRAQARREIEAEMAREAQLETERELARERARAEARLEVQASLNPSPAAPASTRAPTRASARTSAPASASVRAQAAPSAPAASAAKGGDEHTVTRLAVLRETPLGTPIASLEAGSVVITLGEENEDWVHVETAQGASGWVLKDRLD